MNTAYDAIPRIEKEVLDRLDIPNKEVPLFHLQLNNPTIAILSRMR
jgi:hypothetical protein